MKTFKRSVFSLLLTSGLTGIAQGADYGLPSGIQEGNILHCFNWTPAQVKEELPNIAAAGFGSVQISPCQRPDIKVGTSWHDLYRPYDLAFKSSSYCSEEDLKSLCSAAAEYGIKIIVDVVANHVDKTAGYHDTWWDANGRVRWNGGINYGDRYSITHGQLGDYGDINSEDAEVIARAKAYVEKLKSLGVKGIRWDAAKHIGLPSESCNFWSQVTSVPGMYHYGEILDAPGPNASIIKEYCNYMSVTDNKYCNYAARDNGGIPGGFGGDWVVNQKCSDTKMVYWAESHDTYSNDEWSMSRDQSVIDRAYAAYACRNGATALYLSRPNAVGFNNIKVGKGSTAFKNKQVAEVNKFRNAMTGRADWFESNGNACSITRQDGGAVIVMKGSGNVSVKNGGGYCPVGTYTDRVSGGQFTVTAETISGTVGSSGIAVIYKDGLEPPTPPTPPGPGPDPQGSMWILGNLKTGGWSTTPGTGCAMTLADGKYTATGVELAAAAGETKCYFNLTDYVGSTWDDLNMNANRYGAATEGASITLGTPATVVKYANNVDASGCLSWTVAPGKYDFVFDPSAMTLTVTDNGVTPPGPGPSPDPENLPEINGVYLKNTANWSQPYVWAWVDNGPNCTASGQWPGDKMVKYNDTYWKWEVPAGKDTPTKIIFNPGGDNGKTGDLDYVNGGIYDCSGTKIGQSGGDDPIPAVPVITANPASTSFTESVTVTLSVSPAATLYYTTNGQAATTGSPRYSSPLTFTETTTLNVLAVTAEGAQSSKAFTYTKGGGHDDPPYEGTNLITDYYKVNPDKKVGTFKTINMSFNGQKSSTALSNWTENELIAQGVARDVCQAFRGMHERPIVDSYAIYGAYDNENVYLGVQFVYTIWDLYGEGKQPGESKPYNMDGHMMWAFDLDPEKSFDGYINGTGPIWNETQKGAKFNNGVDAVLMCSTKPGVGTPGLFIPTPDGHASYDAQYCKGLPSSFYGYADGLLPSVTTIWGQRELGYDPEKLKGNEGFVDLRGEIDDSAHTFYEFRIPLSVLGVTADYIKSNGIGVMYLDKYGTSPVGSAIYDPAYFDNVKDEYSYGDNTSKEKEDEDIITYSPARLGGKVGTGVNNIITDGYDGEPEYFNLQGIRVADPEIGSVYIVRRGSKISKEVIK